MVREELPPPSVEVRRYQVPSLVITAYGQRPRDAPFLSAYCLPILEPLYEVGVYRHHARAVVFGSFISPLEVSCLCRFIVPRLRSMSFHSSPNSSPRLYPVPSAILIAAVFPFFGVSSNTRSICPITTEGTALLSFFFAFISSRVPGVVLYASLLRLPLLSASRSI